MKSIGVDAFKYCDSLKRIYIPASVTEIDDDAFKYSSKLLKIYGTKGSFAERYAKEKKIAFTAQ